MCAVNPFGVITEDSRSCQDFEANQNLATWRARSRMVPIRLDQIAAVEESIDLHCRNTTISGSNHSLFKGRIANITNAQTPSTFVAIISSTSTPPSGLNWTCSLIKSVIGLEPF